MYLRSAVLQLGIRNVAAASSCGKPRIAAIIFGKVATAPVLPLLAPIGSTPEIAKQDCYSRESGNWKLVEGLCESVAKVKGGISRYSHSSRLLAGLT